MKGSVMLQKLNERVKGWFAWLIVVVVAFTFVLFGIDYYLQTRHSQQPMLDINGESISSQSIEQVYRRLRQTVPHPSQEQDQSLRRKAVDELIARTVTEQSAIKQGFGIAQEQVSSAITQIPEFQEQGHFSPSKYLQVLRASMYTQGSLSQEIQRSMLVNQQHFSVVNTEFVLPYELNEDAALIYEKRDYDYATIDIQSWMNKISISMDEIKHDYQTHKKEFYLPPRISLDYVQLNLEAFKQQAAQEISKEKILAYYNENKASYQTPARWKVSHLLYAFPEHATEAQKQLEEKKAQEAYHQFQKNPLLFNDWVKKYSDDVLSARHEGVLPWLTLKQSDLDEALTKLTQPGQISQPIKTSKGYEIVKLLEYQAAKAKTLEQVESSIKQQLIQETAQVNYSKALETLGELSYQNPDRLEPVANALGLKIETTSLFTRQGGTTELTQNQEVLRQAFSPDVYELGNNSETLQLNPSTVVVIRLKQKVGEQLQSMDEVKLNIEQRLKLQKIKLKLQILTQDLQNGRASLPKGSSWKQVRGEERQKVASNTQAHDMAFSLSGVKNLSGAETAKDQYMLVRLNAIYPGRYQDLSISQKDGLKAQLQSAFGNIAYDLLIQTWIEQAKVVSNIR